MRGLFLALILLTGCSSGASISSFLGTYSGTQTIEGDSYFVTATIKDNPLRAELVPGIGIAATAPCTYEPGQLQCRVLLGSFGTTVYDGSITGSRWSGTINNNEQGTSGTFDFRR